MPDTPETTSQTIEQALAAAMTQPKKYTVDGESIEMRSAAELIELANAAAARKRKGSGIAISKPIGNSAV
jgi:uncharacterized protein (DUF4213/DUF364 family)